MGCINGIITPCYDEKNKIDCPSRSAGCHAKCEQWGSYLQKRDEFYAKRRKQQEQENDQWRFLLDSKRLVERRIRR